jgi:hypothetical protein
MYVNIYEAKEKGIIMKYTTFCGGINENGAGNSKKNH